MDRIGGDATAVIDRARQFLHARQSPPLSYAHLILLAAGRVSLFGRTFGAAIDRCSGRRGRSVGRTHACFLPPASRS